MKRMYLIVIAVLLAAALLAGAACAVENGEIEPKKAGNVDTRQTVPTDPERETPTGGEQETEPITEPNSETVPETEHITEPDSEPVAETEPLTEPDSEPVNAPEPEPAEEPTTGAERPTVPASPESHDAPDALNAVEEPTFFTCGNTGCELTVDGQTYSFMYAPSLLFGDVLNNLVYDEPLCKCEADFTVTPEFSPTYEVNLSQGFARKPGVGQCSLTPTVIKAFRAALEAVTETKGMLSSFEGSDDLFSAVFAELKGE